MAGSGFNEYGSETLKISITLTIGSFLELTLKTEKKKNNYNLTNNSDPGPQYWQWNRFFHAAHPCNDIYPTSFKIIYCTVLLFSGGVV